jgi:hypothetical protein
MPPAAQSCDNRLFQGQIYPSTASLVAIRAARKSECEGFICQRRQVLTLELRSWQDVRFYGQSARDTLLLQVTKIMRKHIVIQLL